MRSRKADSRKEITMENCTPDEWDRAMDRGVDWNEESEFFDQNDFIHPDDESEDGI